MEQLIKCLKASDLSVWQVTPTRDVLAFFHLVKEQIKKPFVVELDDWIFDLPGYNVASNPYKPNSECEWVSYEQMKLADAFIVSTEFIKGKLAEWFPETPCYVIKNSIDFGIWDKLDVAPFIFGPKKEGNIRIGYTGCGNHNEDIEIVKRPIMALIEEYPNLELILPNSFQSWIDIVHPRVLFWNQWASIKEFPGAIKGWEMDIGIAPLRDNTFNCAKSNLRWLEYSALKIPTVASYVEPFKNIVDGHTGYIAKNKIEWYEKLKLLIENESLRKNIGRFAYDEVKKNFNMDKIANQYLSVLREVKRGSKHTSR
jgi:glycosyltransferase involved in cell wall biosynthesis